MHAARVARSRGFTLIEALVALTIFSFIGVGAYQLLASTGRLQEGGEARLHALAGVQFAVRQLEEDFTQFAPRGVAAGRGGDELPALDTSAADAQVELTRNGWRNPLGLQRSRLQRVAWQLDDEGRLLRRYRKSLDVDDGTEQVTRTLAEGIEEFALRFLDEQGKWQESWPPQQASLNPGEKKEDPVPRAVEIRLKQQLIGEIVRVVPLR